MQSGLCLHTLYKTKQKIWHLYSFYTNLEKKIHWGFFSDSLYFIGPLLAEWDGKGHEGSLFFLKVTLKFNQKKKKAFVQHISSEGTVFPYSLFVPWWAQGAAEL